MTRYLTKSTESEDNIMFNKLRAVLVGQNDIADSKRHAYVIAGSAAVDTAGVILDPFREGQF
jgi:hypothetical protein